MFDLGATGRLLATSSKKPMSIAFNFHPFSLTTNDDNSD
jgi:hypothetical protein